MTIEEIKKHFKSKFWLNEIENFKSKYSGYNITKKELSELFNQVDYHISKKQIGRITNWISVALILNEESTIEHIKKKGILRASKYNYNNQLILSVLESIIPLSSKILSISIQNQSYLNSVKNFLEGTSELKKNFLQISKSLKNFEGTILKSLLAFIDYLFLINHEYLPSDKPESLQNYTKEELTEAISFLVYYFNTNIGLKNKHSFFIDEDLILENPVFEDILLNVCRIKQFQEAEILIDNFDYICIKEDKSLTIQPPTHEIEKSIRLGFIHSEIQKQNTNYRISLISPKPVTLDEESEKFYNLFKNELFELIEMPVKRVVFKLPKIPPLIDFINMEKFFFEEIVIFADAYREHFLKISDLQTFCVKDNLTLFDLIRVQRLFNFIRLVINKHLQQYLQNDVGLVLRSLIPSFSKNGIIEILNICLDKEKIQSLLELISWDPNSHKVLDLQYQPILQLEESYLLPSNIFSLSNLVRNILASERVRLFHDGTIDPLQDALVEVLKTKFDNIAFSRKFRYKRLSGDIDVILKFDNNLFIFECKNSLLPTNVFELRTSYDYIQKAANQLDKIKFLLNDQEFKSSFGENLGWNLEEVKNIFTCIVTGNRMFYGYKINGHAVLPIHELGNFIKSGKIVLMNKQFLLWDKNNFNILDLIKFIQNNPIHEATFNSMKRIKTTYKLNNKSLSFNSFKLNLNEMLKEFESKFKFVCDITI